MIRLTLGAPLVLALFALAYLLGYRRGRLVEIRRVLAMTPKPPYVVRGDLEAKNRQGETLDLSAIRERAR